MSEHSDEQIVYPLPRFILSGQARSVRGRRTARLERNGFPRTTPAWLYRSREPLNLSPTARTSSPRPRHVRTSADNDHTAAQVKYRLIEPSTYAAWHASMRNHVAALVGTDNLASSCSTSSPAPSSPPPTATTAPGCDDSQYFVTKRALPRYMLLRPTCCALQHGSPELGPSRLAASKPASKRSTKISRPPKGALGTGTTSNGRTSRTRYATTSNRRPRHSRTNPSTHRTTIATIRPPTLSRASLATGHPRTYQDFPRKSRSMH
jgi:hypothetical protein